MLQDVAKGPSCFKNRPRAATMVPEDSASLACPANTSKSPNSQNIRPKTAKSHFSRIACCKPAARNRYTYSGVIFVAVEHHILDVIAV